MLIAKKSCVFGGLKVGDVSAMKEIYMYVQRNVYRNT